MPLHRWMVLGFGIDNDLRLQELGVAIEVAAAKLLEPSPAFLMNQDGMQGHNATTLLIPGLQSITLLLIEDFVEHVGIVQQHDLIGSQLLWRDVSPVSLRSISMPCSAPSRASQPLSEGISGWRYQPVPENSSTRFRPSLLAALADCLASFSWASARVAINPNRRQKAAERNGCSPLRRRIAVRACRERSPPKSHGMPDCSRTSDRASVFSQWASR